MRRTWIALLLLWGCQSAPSGPTDTVVLIVIDTLRADHVGAYGYTEATTPTLDDLAERGAVFTDATTPQPVTLPAVASLLTGRWPHHHGVRDNAGFVLPDDATTLAEAFGARGWRTAAVVGSAVLRRETGVAQGFDTYDDAFGGPYPVHDPSYASLASQMAGDRRRATTVTDRALALADELGDDPAFLLVHYFDVHAYYDPPPAFAARHPGRPYDGEIAYVDAEIARLLAGLADRDPLVVVVADHGEGLHEHGETEHGFLLYQSTLHVPVILAGPGVPAGLRRDEPVSLVDVAPTLASMFRLEGRFDGIAWDWAAPGPTDRTLHAETFRTLLSYDWSELRALRRGSHKYIHGPRDEAYDLAADPRELSPVSPPPPLVDAMRAHVADDPTAAILDRIQGVDPERAAQLAALGYATGAPTLTRQRPHPADMLPAWTRRQVDRATLRSASLALEAGDLDAAMEQLAPLLAREAPPAGALHLRGLVRERQGRTAEALADMELALTRDPRYAPALRRVVEARLRAGDLDGALPLLRRWVEVEPDSPLAHFNLGLTAQRRDDATTARRHLGRFLELAPDDSRASAVRRTLDQLPPERP